MHLLSPLTKFELNSFCNFHKKVFELEEGWNGRHKPRKSRLESSYVAGMLK